MYSLSGRLSTFVENLKVIASSTVTLLSGVAVLITAFSGSIVSALPANWERPATHISVVVVAWLTTAVTALRRVTPVEPERRGIRPVPDPIRFETVSTPGDFRADYWKGYDDARSEAKQQALQLAVSAHAGQHPREAPEIENAARRYEAFLSEGK